MRTSEFLTSLFMHFAVLILLVACEKQEIVVENNDLRVRSHVIMAYAYEDSNGTVDYITVLPHKIYVSGGTPENVTGYYVFKLAEGSVIPEFLKLDSVCGIIYGSGDNINGVLTPYQFEIQVFDGMKTAVSSYSIEYKNVKSGSSVTVLPLHFTSPETNIVTSEKNQQIGLSLSIEGGVPPYLFSVVPGDNLPGNLKLDGRRGIIYGNVANLKPGSYPFRILCIDSKGTRAKSQITSTEYEVFNLIIR